MREPSEPTEHSIAPNTTNDTETNGFASLLYTTRNEVDGELAILEGEFPKEIFGEFYVIYPVGSVNSDGLPFPEKLEDGSHNPEYNTPIMNGDGYVVRISLDGDAPQLKARVLKSPSYYADYHSRSGTQFHKAFGFVNMGLSRMSKLLGSKNPLNTALTPFNTQNGNTALIAAYDIGRPFILDPVSLDLVSPIGTNNEWVLASPGFMPWPFPFIQATAHPSFDAVTKELFVVNYSSHDYKLMNNINRKEVSIEKRAELKNQFLDMLIEIENRQAHEIKAHIMHFFHSNFTNEVSSLEDHKDPNSGSVLQLLKFTAESEGPMKTWMLHDQYGKPITIQQCMHQTSLSKDYILLSDTSFKVTLDLLVQNFFPNQPQIEIQLRRVLAKPMLPYTDCYIVRRRDLQDEVEKVTAYKLKSPIPVETIHYSCNYENPDGKITMYGMQNTAMCIAEWIRDYDTDKIHGGAVDKDYVSLFALGNMDISRLGKWVIDAEAAEIIEEESKEFVETGNLNQEQIGPHTWSVGLHTFKNIISADEAQPVIDTLWFTSNGLSNKTLTQFIYNLYKHYPNRIIPVEEILKITKHEVPSSICKLDTQSMTATDFYQCPENVYFRSIQYVPGKEDREFLFTTVQHGKLEANGKFAYRGEYWIFDANNLQGGPLCKMHHPEVSFCFTLHSCWLPEALPYNLPYHVNINEDLNRAIGNSNNEAEIREFFEKYVYPHFTSY